jgi:hypothetical protein
MVKDIVPCVYSFLIDPDSTSIIYAGSGGPYLDSGGVYKSTNGGETWGKIGLGEYSITSLVGKFGSLDTIYAGTGGKYLETNGSGVFSSTDNGASWDSINLNLTAKFISSLAIDPTVSSTIYAGTVGGGVFRYDELGINENQNDTLSKPVSLHVYPNPFSEQIDIVCSVGRNAYSAEYMALNIYDVTGRVVRSFDPEDLRPEGQYNSEAIRLPHHVIWDGTDDLGQKLPSGVYFIHLESHIHSATTKCVYLR